MIPKGVGTNDGGENSTAANATLDCASPRAYAISLKVITALGSSSIRTKTPVLYELSNAGTHGAISAPNTARMKQAL